MKPYERFLTALGRGQPDIVPVWELIVNEPVVSTVLGRRVTGTKEDMLNAYCELAEFLDLDGVTWGEDQEMKAVGEFFVDEWGITWRLNRDGIAYPVKGPIKSEKDIIDYSPPDPDASHRLESIEKLVDVFKNERAVVFLGHETFEFSHYLLGGMDRLFKLYYLKPDLAVLLSEKVSEYKCRVIERAIKAGVDAVVCGDDYADGRGPFLPPSLFKKFILPYIKRAVDTTHRAGVPYIKHTDGNLKWMLDMLVEARVDALHPIEPAAGMDIAEVKKRYGDRLCVIGNIDCRKLLTGGSPRDVEEAVKETIAKVAPGGGYILSSSNSIHPGVRPENFVAMVKAARTYGRYPIDKRLIAEYAGRCLYSRLFPEFFGR